MKNYVENLRARVSYKYLVEAHSEQEAIERAKSEQSQEAPEVTNTRIYDFDWLECEVYPEISEIPNYLSNPLFGKK